MSDRSPWFSNIEVDLLELMQEEVESAFSHVSLPEIEKKIASVFNFDSFSISLGQVEWKIRDNFFTGLGDHPVSVSFQLSPIEGDFFLVMGSEDILKFTSWFQDETRNTFFFENPELVKGVYRYMLLESLDVLSTVHPFTPFSFKMTDKTQMEKTGYSIEISLKNGEESIWARLILSPTFKKSYERRFTKTHLTLSDLTNYPHIQLPLSLTIGSFTITPKELEGLQEGDFILADEITLRPHCDKGSLLLNFHDNPLFLLRYKEGKITVVEEANNYSEERT